MNDERVLFERSVVDIEVRPAFRTELIRLYEDVAASPTATGSTSVPLVEPTSDKSSQSKHGRSRGWLMLAAGVVVVIGLAALQRGTSLSDRTASFEPPVGSGQVSAACVSSVELGTVASDVADLRVGLLDDGQTFCLGRESSTGASSSDSVAIGLGVGTQAPSEPELLEAAPGPAGTRTYFYLFVIPDTIPLADVVSDDGRQQSFFVSRVGRRLIIIDTDVDGQSPTTVPRVWMMFSSTRSYLGDLEADGPSSRSTSTTTSSAP